MGNQKEGHGMGWLPDYPDFRDYTKEHEEISRIIPLRTQKSTPRMPTSVDLRAWCSPVEDQGALGSCTANAGIGVVEYYENRAFGKCINASRLFLYKTTRNLLHWTGDTGAFLRTTMAALVLFGAPPEEYWSYEEASFDKEPSAFCYSFAQNFQAIRYYRHDTPGISKDSLLASIKSGIAKGHPSMFGFTVYNSLAQADKTGRIPYPCKGERILGGHAIVAVGYDDQMEIRNSGKCGTESTGALLIRNSWGTGWGESGYGWLPYEYVLKGIAVDFWSILKKEWIDTEAFNQ